MDRRFDHHAPKDTDTIKFHESTRYRFKDLAIWVERFIPEGREKALVLTKLEEGLMWANAAIARDSHE